MAWTVENAVSCGNCGREVLGTWNFWDLVRPASVTTCCGPCRTGYFQTNYLPSGMVPPVWTNGSLPDPTYFQNTLAWFNGEINRAFPMYFVHSLPGAWPDWP